MMRRIDEAIAVYKENLKSYLKKEIIDNGDYQQWYDDLKGFRLYMRDKYIGKRLGKDLYTVPYVYNSYGDYLDHHLSSYIAPLDFIRIGWGGERLTPVEHVSKLAKWFEMGGGRFVYVPLPNKGVIYPELICNDNTLFKRKTSCAPQWRKYVNDLVDSGIEIFDIYSVFREYADKNGLKEPLYAKEHNISGIGAKVIADAISSYLKCTTDTIEENCQISQAIRYYYQPNTYNSKIPNYINKYYTNFIESDGVKKPYWNQTINSDIVVFGDCNLQAHSHLGAGIISNLAYNLQTHIFDGGRQLIFDNFQTINDISIENLLRMRTAKIAVYIAFASASYVRSSTVISKHRLGCLKHLFSNYKWNTIQLK